VPTPAAPTQSARHGNGATQPAATSIRPAAAAGALLLARLRLQISMSMAHDWIDWHISVLQARPKERGRQANWLRKERGVDRRQSHPAK
jgi:hypothetical protein